MTSSHPIFDASPPMPMPMTTQMNPGHYGIKVDTRACTKVSGCAFMAACIADGHKYLQTGPGQHGEYEPGHERLATTPRSGGVGDGRQSCVVRGIAYGCLADGTIMEVGSPILNCSGRDDPQYDTRARWGAIELWDVNAVVGCRQDRVHMVAESTEDQI